MGDEEKKQWRANYVGAPHFYNLNQACALINRAFPQGMCYLVGSSLTKKDYRDVDVRLMLPDEEYDRVFGSGDWANPFWSLLCTSLSLWLRQQTDLPVDFQIQRQTQANEMHDGKRSAVGIFLDYPGERPSDVKPVSFVSVANDPPPAPTNETAISSSDGEARGCTWNGASPYCEHGINHSGERHGCDLCCKRV